MCGIFGFSGKKGKKANLRKLQILGILNTERGTDSCGYYYSGTLQKGIHLEANFARFLTTHKLVKGELEGEVFMGHTRKSTCGAHNEENAHPHMIGNYVQTHNGVIKNIWDLCSKHGVPHVHPNNISVDSIGLAHIIQKDGFEVLNQYIGHAALSMTFMDDPTSLYLYHGASKEKESDELLTIERPLFYIITPEGLYYSSMEEHLEVICEGTQKPIRLIHNAVVKITDGIIVDPCIFAVKRSLMNIPVVIDYKNNEYDYVSQSWIPKKQTTIPFRSTTETPYQRSVRLEKELLERVNANMNRNSCGLPDSKIIPLYDNEKKNLALDEKFPAEYLSQNVYYRRGRHYRANNVLLNGVYEIDRAGMFVDKSRRSERHSEEFYFIRGVMMKSEKMYKLAIKNHPDILTNLRQNIAYLLSLYSSYPVLSLRDEATNPDQARDIWYKNRKPATMNYTPKFSKKYYDIVNGSLRKITWEKVPEGEPYVISVKESTTDLVDNNGRLSCTSEEIIKIDQPNPQIKPDEDMDFLIKNIKKWMLALIFEDDIKSMPEYYLMYLDFYCYLQYRVDMPEGIIERDVTALLKNLRARTINFKEYLEQLTIPSSIDFLADKTIIDCFKNWEFDDIIREPNRYEFIDFETHTEKDDKNPEDEEEKYAIIDEYIKNPQGIFVPQTIANKETNDLPFVDTTASSRATEIMDELRDNQIELSKEKITELLELLNTLGEKANQLESFDAVDACQDIAYGLLQKVEEAKKQVQEIVKENPAYRELLTSEIFK